MKSLVVPTFTAILVLGSVADAIAQSGYCTSPPVNAVYSNNAKYNPYMVIPVDATVTLPSTSPYAPTVMYVDMYQLTPPSGSVLVPSWVFTQGATIPRISVTVSGSGSVSYRFQGNVHVSNGGSDYYFFRFTFFDPYFQQFVPDANSGSTYYLSSFYFGAWTYITHGPVFAASSAKASKPVAARTRRRVASRRSRP